MPRPDNPDSTSLKATSEEGTSGSAPVLDYPRYQGSLGQELQKDVQYVLEGITHFRHSLRSNFRWLFNQRRPSVNFGPPETAVVYPLEDFSPVLVERVSDMAQQTQAGEAAVSSPRGLLVPNVPAAPTAPAIVDVHSPQNPTSPPQTPNLSESEEMTWINESEPSNVRIRTRQGSTSTLHMDVEFMQQRGGPALTSSFAASSRPPPSDTRLPSSLSKFIRRFF